jgi:hypothetical protein
LAEEHFDAQIVIAAEMEDKWGTVIKQRYPTMHLKPGATVGDICKGSAIREPARAQGPTSTCCHRRGHGTDSMAQAGAASGNRVCGAYTTQATETRLVQVASAEVRLLKLDFFEHLQLR